MPDNILSREQLEQCGEKMLSIHNSFPRRQWKDILAHDAAQRAEIQRLTNRQSDIAAWAEDTFGPTTVEATVKRIDREFREFFRDPVKEAPDIVIFLYRLMAISGRDLDKAVDEKMAVNKARQWVLAGDGTGQHVGSESEPGLMEEIQRLTAEREAARVAGATALESAWAELAALRAKLEAANEDTKRKGVYVASRASIPERSAMWRERKSAGVDITSSWIYESGIGETESFTELWSRIDREIKKSVALVVYAESRDFPLKGALVEVGIALGQGIPVIVCLPEVQLEERSCRPIGSWIQHPLVKRIDNIDDAIRAAMKAGTDEGTDA